MEHVLVAEHRHMSRKVLLTPQAERPIYGVRADCPEFLLTQPPVDFGGKRIPLQVRRDALRVEIFDGKFGIVPLSWGSVCNAFVGTAACFARSRTRSKCGIKLGPAKQDS